MTPHPSPDTPASRRTGRIIVTATLLGAIIVGLVCLYCARRLVEERKLRFPPAAAPQGR